MTIHIHRRLRHASRKPQPPSETSAKKREILTSMKIGFVGQGNVGGKLAGSILRNGHELLVRDLDDGVIAGLGPGKIWLKMSTTDEAEVKRLGEVTPTGGQSQ